MKLTLIRFSAALIIIGVLATISFCVVAIIRISLEDGQSNFKIASRLLEQTVRSPGPVQSDPIEPAGLAQAVRSSKLFNEHFTEMNELVAGQLLQIINNQ